MSKLNYELTMCHSPYHDTLIEELNSIIKQKKNLYKNIYSEKEFESKLSYEEKEIIKHLAAREDKILLELIEHKGWLNRFDEFDRFINDRRTVLNNFDEDIEYRAHNSGY